MKETLMETIITPDQKEMQQKIVESLEGILGINKNQILTLVKKVHNIKDGEQLSEKEITANNIINSSLDPNLPILDVISEESKQTKFLSITYGNQSGELSEKFITIIKKKESGQLTFTVETEIELLAKMFGL